MRPVTKPAQPASYAPPATLQFVDGAKSKNATLMNGLLGSANPTLAACLNLWKDVANRAMLKQANTKDQERGADLVSDKIGDIYRAAGPPLLNFLGEYCSYCESPLPGALDVEHTVNKSGFPTYSCDWDNFLMACSACNGAASKGNKPTRLAAWTEIKTTNPNPTEADYYDLIRNLSYVWPDRTNLNSYQVMLPRLFFDSGSGAADPYKPLLDTVAHNPSNRVTYYDRVTHDVYANLYNGTKLVGQNTRVQVRMTPSDKRAMAMTRLINLNREVTTVTDRRVPNRTLAWFDTLADIRRLLATTDFTNVWEGMVDHSKGRGFYSIYIRLLSRYKVGTTSLAARFVADTNNNLLFPNTNTALVP